MTKETDIKARGWIEFQLSGPLTALELFAEFMNEQGSGGAVFSEDPNEKGDQMVTSFLSITDAGPEIIDLINKKVDELNSKFPGNWSDLQTATVADQDWSEEWKKSLKPIRFEPGIWIVPNFKEVPKEAANEKVIRLDPGLAFGTGLHETTSMCISVVSKEISPSTKNVLDLGTGTGVLAMTAALFGARQVLAVDIDPLAVKVASENILKNGRQKQITVINGVSDTTSDLPEGPFDLVVANIYAEALEKLMPFISRQLKPEGTLVLSGILTEREHIVDRALKDNCLSETDKIQEHEWVTKKIQKL
jgi:ribosomal protein L11 methyltransferase